jgi:hypothetical protein
VLASAAGIDRRREIVGHPFGLIEQWMNSGRRCHGASGLRSHWRLGSQGDEENQLHRVPVSA